MDGAPNRYKNLYLRDAESDIQKDKCIAYLKDGDLQKLPQDRKVTGGLANPQSIGLKKSWKKHSRRPSWLANNRRRWIIYLPWVNFEKSVDTKGHKTNQACYGLSCQITYIWCADIEQKTDVQDTQNKIQESYVQLENLVKLSSSAQTKIKKICSLLGQGNASYGLEGKTVFESEWRLHKDCAFPESNTWSQSDWRVLETDKRWFGSRR